MTWEAAGSLSSQRPPHQRHSEVTAFSSIAPWNPHGGSPPPLRVEGWVKSPCANKTDHAPQKIRRAGRPDSSLSCSHWLRSRGSPPDGLLGRLGTRQHPPPGCACARTAGAPCTEQARPRVGWRGEWSGARCVPALRFPCRSRPPSRRRIASWDRERSPSEAARWTRDSSA